MKQSLMGIAQTIYYTSFGHGGGASYNICLVFVLLTYLYHFPVATLANKKKKRAGGRAPLLSAICKLVLWCTRTRVLEHFRINFAFTSIFISVFEGMQALDTKRKVPIMRAVPDGRSCKLHQYQRP